MIKLPDGSICAQCPRLVNEAYKQPDKLAMANNLMQIDENIRMFIAGSNPQSTDKNKQLPHGRIDGRIDNKLIYVAPFVNDISESFLLHAHLLMSDTKTLRSCMMLAVNKMTGDVSMREFNFNEELVIDFLSIAKEQDPQPAINCFDCVICPFSEGCNEFSA